MKKGKICRPPPSWENWITGIRLFLKKSCPIPPYTADLKSGEIEYSIEGRKGISPFGEINSNPAHAFSRFSSPGPAGIRRISPARKMEAGSFKPEIRRVYGRQNGPLLHRE